MKKALTIIVISLIFVFLIHAAPLNDRSDVNGFDRNIMFPYSSSLDKSADIINYGLALTPALLSIGRDTDDIVTLGVMYAETFIGTYATKEILKAVVDRPRPYTYFEGAPEEDIEDWNNSFPSGHTALSFASAGFISYVFSAYYPESSWRIPVTIAAYSAAAATSVLRILGGNHFMSDVLAGAAIGTLWGVGIPMLHTLGDNVKMGVTPFALAFSLSF